jgi:leucyl-tRNA synthetase
MKDLYTVDILKAEKPFYNLWMFPYPSAEGLHAGHAFASTGSDIYGRFMRMHGYNVFQPIGYDSFGIHSENYALKTGEQPQTVVQRTTKYYEQQLRSMGHGYDWTKTVTTSDPEYYRWTQWLFLQMWEAGLAYKKKAGVNFCPSCKTVLADEQVISGECERCQSVVTKKELEQWFFKITDYADRLLSGLSKIDWSERVVKAQREWIGKSEGMMIKFKTEDRKDLEVFTTRPDTLNAVTFLATSELYKEGSHEKVGEFSGRYAISPLDGRKIPIWDTNYVTPDYGTGIIMGVPAHDERDMEFAKKYHLDVINKAPDIILWEKIEKNGWGYKHTNYHLRDWLVSRQRYWGAPIPMIFCEKCQWVPVPEKELPVRLPTISDYKPEGTGKGPLANHPDFYEVACPECGSPARRETDVMDTFVDSSWYFLRYPSVGSFSSDSRSALPRVSAKTSRAAAAVQNLPWDPEITKKWLPVDLYFGGAEHSVLHLMYSRFVTMVLHDRGYLDFEEPFPKFFAHGLVIKDGAKMSKSRGNVVNPDEYIQKYGADALRLYLMFMGPMDGSPDFRDTGIEGMGRFVKRVRRLFTSVPITKDTSLASQNIDVVIIKMHQTIKKVTEDIQEFKYNTAIAAIMEYINVLSEYQVSSVKFLRVLALLLAPFAPHLAEEVWHSVLGQKSSIHTSPWPKYDTKYLEVDQVIVVVQVNGKLRGQIQLKAQSSKQKEEIEKMAKSNEKITKWLKDKKIKKVIFVPGKLINFVV